MSVKRERGASAILVALALLVLFGFAAIAVDSGMALDERRQEQSGVDAGALSAGLSAQASPVQTGCSGSGLSLAACNGAMVAIRIINQNADTPYPMSAFDNATLCADAAFPAEFRSSGGGRISTATDGAVNRTLECIRWTSNLRKVHIILPVTQVATTFGRILGRLSISVNANAEAEATLKNPGQVIPFVVGPTGANANLNCLFEPPSGIAAPPCDGPTSGNFGYMKPYLYGDPTFGTPTDCSSVSQDGISSALAMGADHVYALNPSVPGLANDRDHCPNKNQLIDEIDVRTGGTSNPVEVGAFGSIFGIEGRLRCKDGDASEPSWFDPLLSSAACTNVNNNHPETLDSTPLWSFIDPGASAESGGACNGGINSRSAMANCLTAWRSWGAHTIDLFTVDLGTSPRFAWVPRVNIDPDTGGSGFYTIEEFLPVYLQTAYLKCNSSSCDVAFDPGQTSSGSCSGFGEACGYPSNGNKSLDALSAFILRKDMLPFPLSDFPGEPGQLTFNLSR
jgi:hypothetical protein